MRLPMIRLGSLSCVLWLIAACGASHDPVLDTSRPDSSVLLDGGHIELPEGCDPVEATYAGFAEVFFAARCTSCHSATLTGAARSGAPAGTDFDDEAGIAYQQARIRVRAVDDRTMPPGAPLSDCDAARLSSYLETLGGEGACEPACGDNQCGDDGCGGSCGSCVEGQTCAASGECVDASCVPMCEGVACGDDGCGGSCGECGVGFSCSPDHQCTCAPACEGKQCGDDGCGGSCGDCDVGAVCGIDGACLCVPRCEALVCGDDGCGGGCGTCGDADSCASDQASCECVPDCTGKRCGDDGCGGECPDTCMGAMTCRFRDGTCKAGPCTKDCSGRECGSDNCGGFCGSSGGACGDGEACSDSGTCACAPSCVGKACGDDGCGGTCGECADGLSCNTAGQCGCTADCSGRECGSDGCGGSCGDCGDGLSCSSGGCVEQCVPSCSGKACGDDGCGGSCGACSSGASCESGACVAAPVTFADVFAIFESKGCADTGCHGTNRSAEGLNLTTPSSAQADLIGVSSMQCTNKKLVQPGDSAQSYLINKLTGVGMCSGSQMPKGSSPLTNTQLDVVRTWIDSL